MKEDMKIKSLVSFLGFRGKSQHYSYEIKRFDLAHRGIINYAQWLHPGESQKSMTAEIVDAYCDMLDEGDFCIDIGAHTGDSTLPMALAVGRSGCVLALEPNPYVYHVLEKNARASDPIGGIKAE